MMTGRKHSKGWISCLSITFDREYVKIIVSKRTDEKMTDPKAQAMAVLQKNHLRVTKQRKTLIDFLVAYPDRYVSVTEIDKHMRQFYPGVSHNTVYRNLEEFQEIGLVELSSQTGGMVVKYRCDESHHHHFVCQRCGRVQEIQFPPIDWDFLTQQLPGAKVTGHSFELYGLCAQCRQLSSH